MSVYVLVHGAWQGASTWDWIVPQLRAAGRAVYVPFLTGLGAHAHHLTPEINLTTHIQDVLSVLEYENLHHVTLVGHSYAGMIITGVAEAARERIARLVYVDAFVPQDGQSVLHLLPEPFQQAFRAQAETEGDGWRLKASERQLDLWGLHDPLAREFVRAKLCDFSLNCFAEPLSLPTNAAANLDRTYIACTAENYPARVAFQPFAAQAQREGWRYFELPTGHDCHVEMPEEFSQILLNLN
jgi:pimeloyl-ACP methyl ester carboxylesterase